MPAMDRGPIALYVHIPFCETKCPYCDFNTYAGIEPLIPDYVEALNTEIRGWGRLLGRPKLATVFFGGGTPSYLPTEDVGSLTESINASFDVDAQAEVTLEANPGDLGEVKLAEYLALGINRLSIGVQSLDDRLLGVLGRRHSAAEAVASFEAAVRAGFDNVSIDLMYGLPYQSLADWSRTLSQALDLRPPHISAYCLTLEGGTPMEQSVASGRMPEPDPDLAADMYEMAEEATGNGGYRHYEISNWARPGRESLHNLTYWRNELYLGVGPGAHSYLWGYRFHNLKSPREYISRLAPDASLSLGGGDDAARRQGQDEEEVIRNMPAVESAERIDRRLEMAETMMLGLRLDVGVSDQSFIARFGISPRQFYGETLDELSSAGLLEAADGALRLTARGRLLGNEVFSRFFDYAAATA